MKVRAAPLVAIFLAFLVACSASDADPVFESTSVSDVSVRGGDCAEQRCVEVTSPVIGSRTGQGSCELYGPGDPDDLKPLASSGDLEMTPGEDTVWTVELSRDAPVSKDLNPVCEPTIEG